MKWAYYNEHDPFAAAWLRELIKAGQVAPGEVDERDIRDVTPDELRGFAQCHFFAGIGVWSYALRLAGWPDERPVWTGSCPCQPFSAAGAGAGFADERHLWPALFHLIEQCRPEVAFGEQVASKDGLTWLDLVAADLEGAGYAFAAADLCAAGFGAPHIRQRLFWVADTGGAERGRWAATNTGAGVFLHPAERGSAGELGDSSGQGLPARERPALLGEGRRDEGGAAQQPGGALGGMGDPNGSGREDAHASQADGEPDGLGAGRANRVADATDQRHDWRRSSRAMRGGTAEPQRLRDAGEQPPAGPTNGFWRAADWLFCRDGKWRPVRPGTFPLAHGAANRVGLLRGAGNAIVAQAAQAFIEAYCEAREMSVGLVP